MPLSLGTCLQLTHGLMPTSIRERACSLPILKSGIALFCIWTVNLEDLSEYLSINGWTKQLTKCGLILLPSYLTLLRLLFQKRRSNLRAESGLLDLREECGPDKLLPEAPATMPKSLAFSRSIPL